MTDDERRNYLYGEVGACLHLAQAMELHLAALVSTVNRKLETCIDAKGLVIPHYKETLGALIAQLRRLGTFDENGERFLGEALVSRNYVAHDFFNRNAHAFGSDEVFKQTKVELAKHQKRIAIGTGQAVAWYNGLRDALDLDGSALLVEQDYTPSGEVH
jgi:hypothetical protein